MISELGDAILQTVVYFEQTIALFFYFLLSNMYCILVIEKVYDRFYN